MNRMISLERRRTTGVAGVLAALTLLAGCSKVPTETTTNTEMHSKEATSGTGAGRSDVGQPERTKNEFKKLEFDRAAVPKGYPYQGKILDGAKWVDANGENTLIVSQDNLQEDQLTRQNIFGYLYVTKDGDTKLLWKIHDWAENECDLGEGLVSKIDVQDLDGDGVAENAFVYNVLGGCDVSPLDFKLIMHSGERKFAIRGDNRVNLAGKVIGGRKNFDPSFSSAPSVFRDYASNFWDRNVKP